jgi:hypothetical protein
MSELEVLDLSLNALTGSIPPRIWSLKKLQELFVDRTNITGEIVVHEFAAKSFTYISISENYNHTVEASRKPLGIWKTLYTCTSTTTTSLTRYRRASADYRYCSMLDLSNNGFNGTLPPELGKHSDLGWLYAGHNELTGAIPEGLCARGRFSFLTARGNHLNGSILTGLASCTGLLTLALDDNQLSGDVPAALWTASQLQYLTLRNNQLTGNLF